MPARGNKTCARQVGDDTKCLLCSLAAQFSSPRFLLFVSARVETEKASPYKKKKNAPLAIGDIKSPFPQASVPEPAGPLCILAYVYISQQH